ncbi:MAG: PQQ-dependent sugar dehydrogenase [Candidatus Latescibacteria bacterium]|nr:PQQ-dependent sugar dehydrogenase [Candidatus Latescibacterota bacterium]
MKMLYGLVPALLTGLLLPGAAQTQEIVETARHNFRAEIFVDGLEVPWGMVFLPDGQLLLSERAGTLRLVSPQGQLSPPLDGVPPVHARGQGGLMDVALHPNFATNGWLYLSYSEALKNETGDLVSFTTIARAQLTDAGLQGLETIYRAPLAEYSRRQHHYGSRIVFDAAGYLFFSIGDRGQRPEAQDTSLPNGKIHRLHDDGRIPADNPFADQAGAAASIWSYGHRNPQGLAIHPQDGTLWDAEHGPRGGDELNLVKPGRNYGWPTITYGINYNGTPITDQTHQADMEQPTLHWTPSIAVCGIDFYSGDRFPYWRHNLLVTALAQQHLRRVQLDADRAIHQELIYQAPSRIRDVETGPDGLIYLALEDPGRIVRLVPVD